MKLKFMERQIILLIGLGSIGERHLKNLRSLFSDALIVVYRHIRSKTKEDLLSKYADKVVYNLNEAIKLNPVAAIISNPASHHVKIAAQLAKSNIHLFIEKPISNDLNGIEHLIKLCQKHDLVLMVGYNLRFQTSLIKMKYWLEQNILGSIFSVQINVGQYLPDWRPQQDYRHSVSAQKALGGGVVFELSHELDCLYWLFGKPNNVFAGIKMSGQLDIDVEDIADMFFEYPDKSATIHLDMLQKNPCRRYKIFGEKGMLVWDGVLNKCERFILDNQAISHEVFQGDEDKNMMYVRELEHFFNCIDNKLQPLISGKDGFEVLKMILSAKKSSHKKKVIAL